MIDFLGIGAQKAGTTWLFSHLSSHPQIRFPAGKEVHFWDRQRSLGVEAWVNLFRDSPPGLKQGEITPAYAFLELEVIAEIYEVNPNLRLFYSIRNPIARAWSSAQMAREQAGLTTAQVPTQWYIDHVQGPGSRKRGDFLATLNNWSKVFPPRNLHLIHFDDIQTRPKRVLGSLANHLGIDPLHFAAQHDDVLRVPVRKGPDVDVPPAVLQALRNIYAKEILALSEHVGRDLTGWLKWDGRRIS